VIATASEVSLQKKTVALGITESQNHRMVGVGIPVKVQPRVDKPGFGGVECLSLRPRERLL